MQSYDVVIIGAGMVGLTLAAALREQSIKIAIIETQNPTFDIAEQPTLRVSAINHASQNILNNIGVWQGIVEQRLQAYQKMEVWERDSFGKIHFDAASLHVDHLGHIIENRVIETSLLKQVTQQANVDLHMPAVCEQVVFGERETWLSLKGGQHIGAKLVIACDGANSWLRQQANIPITFNDYGHTALVATIRTELPHKACARQIFSTQGPLAFLPLWQENLCSIVWSLPPEKATQLESCSEAEFNQALTIAFDHKLGLCSLESNRELFPLKMRYSHSFVKSRLALCGDAAHTIHPLAGQGANLGLQDAAALAQTIIAALNKGEDIGCLRQLKAYERWRKAEATKMITAMQALKFLFSVDNSAVKWLRDAGISLTNKASPVKQILIKQAMGLTGDLPDLAK